MEIRKLNASYGWRWIKQGYQLIMLNHLMAVSLALICALIMFVAFNIPQFGQLIAVLLMPVLMAGYMRICRALEEEEEIEIAHMFTGFQKHIMRLTVLGGYALLGSTIVAMLMLIIGGEALGVLLENVKTANDPQVLADAMWTAGSNVAFSLLIGFTLLFILMLALQFAPMLVYFNNMQPFTALRASLAGSLRNLVPYTIYSLILQLMGLVLGYLPFGVGLIVLLPLCLTSLYVSYRNIFPFENEITPSAASSIEA